MKLFRTPEGHVKKARFRIGQNKDICVNSWNGATFAHFNDTFKAFDANNKFDKTMEHCIKTKGCYFRIGTTCNSNAELAGEFKYETFT
jgi:hypothetical protein